MEPVRILAENRGFARLLTNQGELTARIAPKLYEQMQPVTGDRALYDPALGLVTALEPRRTVLTRKRAGRPLEEQVLAANVDVAFLVSGLDGDFNLRRLERFLVLVRHAGVEPVIVLNKADLAPDPLACLTAVDRLAPGSPAILMSATDGDGVHQMHRYVEAGQTAVLLGSSGVGKSTIVNRLLGAQRQSTAAVRAGDSRGRHTTTGRELFVLPQGWMLIDTPGLRELEPWADEAAVADVFADITALAAGCRFRDCRHQQEPGCAVRGQVEAGRLAAYHKLLKGMAYLEAESDPLAARARKEYWKRIHKAIRHLPDRQ